MLREAWIQEIEEAIECVTGLISGQVPLQVAARAADAAMALGALIRAIRVEGILEAEVAKEIKP